MKEILRGMNEHERKVETSQIENNDLSKPYGYKAYGFGFVSDEGIIQGCVMEIMFCSVLSSKIPERKSSHNMMFQIIDELV